LVLGLLGATSVNAHPTDPVPTPITAIATPADSNHTTNTLEKRGNIGAFYICKGKYFRGECSYYMTPFMDVCYNFRPNWQKAISSFGPDEVEHENDAFTCTLYSRTDCWGLGVKKQYPGTGDLSIYNMDKLALSVKCDKGTEY
jgi:hypothetical protein